MFFLVLPGGLPFRFVAVVEDEAVVLGDGALAVLPCRPRGLDVSADEALVESAFFGGLPLLFGAADEAAVVSFSADLGGRPLGLGSSENETLLLGDVMVRFFPELVKMDLGGRPRGLGAAEVEAALVSAEASARMAGVVRVDLEGRPLFLGKAGVEGPAVDASEMLPTSLDL